jgi:16S rRNA (cytosine967-C5)-methyltransferase
VQDVAASIPARLLGAGRGPHRARSLRRAGRQDDAARRRRLPVTAIDASESRLARLSENLARTGLDAEIVVTRTSSTGQPPEPVDAILLDAPCSATGIFRRHPDVLHRVRPRAIAELAEAQKAMLARAADWLKPGGTFVYSVCSLEPEEGEQVADWFLAGLARSIRSALGELAAEMPLRDGFASHPARHVSLAEGGCRRLLRRPLSGDLSRG